MINFLKSLWRNWVVGDGDKEQLGWSDPLTSDELRAAEKNAYDKTINTYSLHIVSIQLAAAKKDKKRHSQHQAEFQRLTAERLQRGW